MRSRPIFGYGVLQALVQHWQLPDPVSMQLDVSEPGRYPTLADTVRDVLAQWLLPLIADIGHIINIHPD